MSQAFQLRRMLAFLSCQITTLSTSPPCLRTRPSAFGESTLPLISPPSNLPTTARSSRSRSPFPLLLCSPVQTTDRHPSRSPCPWRASWPATRAGSTASGGPGRRWATSWSCWRRPSTRRSSCGKRTRTPGCGWRVRGLGTLAGTMSGSWGVWCRPAARESWGTRATVRSSCGNGRWVGE